MEKQEEGSYCSVQAGGDSPTTRGRRGGGREMWMGSSDILESQGGGLEFDFMEDEWRGRNQI